MYMYVAVYMITGFSPEITSTVMILIPLKAQPFSNIYYRDCVCVSIDYHIIHIVNYYNIYYRDCGCGAGDSGCSICGCCKVCAGLKDSWGGGMSFYELQGILIIHIYIQECMQMKVMIGKESEFS